MLKVRETNELLPAEHKKREDRRRGRFSSSVVSAALDIKRHGSAADCES